MVDMAGVVIGRLTVIRRAGSKNTFVTWLVRCTCGNEKVLRGHDLRKGKLQCCGCTSKERQRAKVTRHGMTHSRTWNSWLSMRQRCESPGDPSYHRYGGRGIRVCDRWGSFETFLADMGERPPGKTLDRKDVDGPYEPGNCRWATGSEQALNRRSNRLISYAGQTLRLAEWSKKTGLKRSAIAERLRRGWTIHDALTVPTDSSAPLSHRKAS
jgi:hypothetical protein